MQISEKHSETARENLKKADAARLARRIAKSCEQCGKAMLLPPSVAARKRFCGWECRQAFMRGPHGANSGHGQKMRGAANPRWNGGHSTLRRRTYKEAEVAQWRRRVFHRDSYTCQRCSLRPSGSNQLRAHHIAPWAKYPTLRFDLDNGITLCRACHAWVHSPDNQGGEFLR